MVIETIPKKILDLLNSGVIITATDLDIRNLNSVTDNISTFSEQAAQGETQIIRAGQIVDATATLYTVPDGKVLYITSAYVSGRGILSNVTGICSVNIPGFLSIIGVFTQGANDGTVANAVGFLMPIKVAAGDIVTFSASTDAQATGGFSGWIQNA